MLGAAQIFDRRRHLLVVGCGLAELRQHRDAARGDVLGRGIEQRAVVGERNVVEIIFEIVDVEGGPAAVAALHALDPFAAARDRHIIVLGAGCAPHPIHRHDDHGGVVEIGIMRVVVLERPAAGPHVRALHRPVALEVEHLFRHQPVEAPFRRGVGRLARPPPSWRGRSASCPTPARRRAGNRPRSRRSPAACRCRAASPRAADNRRACRARRRPSRYWPSADRSRPCRLRR